MIRIWNRQFLICYVILNSKIFKYVRLSTNFFLLDPNYEKNNKKTNT